MEDKVAMTRRKSECRNGETYKQGSRIGAVSV